ncbi:MAG TPA: tetratricopeptide repeat protein, partial [Polyangiaceae bacterium]|nr:tetratricopeptide repeat protein [Polyangiaceae bacterium]
MDLQGLRSALERLFDLPGLLALARDDLAIDPTVIGTSANGEASDVASFARALTLYCAQNGQLTALTEAAVAWFPDAGQTFAGLRNESQISAALVAAGAFGPFEVKEYLGTGPTGHSYRALFNDRTVRLKVFHPHASADREALHRVQTQTRLQRRLPHCGLPHAPQAGSVGDQPFIAHDWAAGETVAQRLATAGPQAPEWMRDLLAGLLPAVNALHEIGLCAACIKPNNVLFSESDQGIQVILLDVGANLLHGASASVEQDFHDLGALAYQILSGVDPTEVLNEPLPKPKLKPPSSTGQANFDAPAVDTWVLDLLSAALDSKLNASALRETVLQLDLSSGESQISVVELQTRLDALLGNPLSNEALADVEQALTLGASRASVGSAIFQAAETAAQQQPGASGTMQLYTRAAELLANAGQFVEAETALERSKALSPDFLPNTALFERICRGLNKLDTLIEGLLERSDAEPTNAARAALLGKIADVYDRELRDQEQALVAYTQALCEYPSEPRYGLNVERIAGQSLAHWEEVLLACSQATAQLEPGLSRALLLQMGKWYARLAQVDLAVACYKAVLEQNPGDLAAYSALDQMYRNNQQWTELHSLLLTQVQQVMDPVREQTLRCQIAEIAETRLSDPRSAQTEYTKVLSINPAHDGAYQGLTRLLERSGDFAGLVLAQQQRARILPSVASAALYCQAASLCVAQLKDLTQAKGLYQAAFVQDPDSLDALQGLESVFTQQKQFDQLIDNLKQQQSLAATPRARVDLLFRIAALYDSEFLDHEKSAQALEELLALEFNHAEARTALLRQYRGLGRFEAIASLLGRIARETDDPEQKLAALTATAQLFENDIQDPVRAISAYEAVLAVSPSHAEALAALAKLRESTGDSQAALQAVLALAEKATNSAERVPHLLRAGQLHLSARDYQSACDQFRALLDIDPGNGPALIGLRDALTGLGDTRGIVALLEQQLTRTEGNHAKAKLLLELATTLNAQVGDKAGASNAVKRALELDPTLSAALLLSADIAYESQQYREASSSFQKLLGQSASLAPDVARRVLLRQIDALCRLDSASTAAQLIDPLLKVAAGDVPALLVAASLSFEHGSAEQTSQLCTLLLSEHASALDAEQTALLTFRLGESQRRMGSIDLAIATLEEAADLDVDAKAPLESLALAQAAQGNWAAAVRSKERLLDLIDGAERAELLIDLGDVINDKLGDRARAVKSFTAALEVRPDNRKLLTRLMALYSESREWLKLLDVVAQLASLVDSDEQKSKYLLTAAMVCQRELGELERAADLYSQVLSLDPGNKKAQ